MPGMSDYVIGVKENGMAALGGAALVKAATGEEADDRELGGTEMHSSVSGVVEYLVEDDAHGILKAREVMKSIDWNKRVTTVVRRPYEPRVSQLRTRGRYPVDPKVPYDFREVLARIVDDSSVEEFKSRYGVSTVCGYASITGISFGFIGNNGPIDPNGATKAAQFIQLCDAADMPILFFNNTTGYMVGTEYEQAGMIKHGSKMIQAVLTPVSPRFRSTSVPVLARVTTACAAGPISRISCLPGPMRAQVSWQGKALQTPCRRWRGSVLREKVRRSPRRCSSSRRPPSEPTLTHKKTPSIPQAAYSITALLIRAIHEKSWRSVWRRYLRLVCAKHGRTPSA